MCPGSEVGRIIRFGVFEVDLHSGELRRNGLKVKLQGQPFQILALLLERPGEVVTRDDLRSRLWPADTFVDFEHSLNAAIKRLRETLGDSAEKPIYIETLPRRGYRFLAPIQNGSATTTALLSLRNRSPCLLAPCSWQLRDYSHSSTGVFFPSILARHRRLQCGWPLSQRFQGQSLTPRSLRMESRSHLCGIVTTASPQIFM